MTYTKTTDDLLIELSEQHAALKASCEAYDRGFRWEAKRLAAIAYMLLHDGGKSRSLLGQLRLKLEFISSKRGPDAPIPLATITISPDAGAFYQPNLGNFPNETAWLKFSKWYNEVIFSSGALSLSRKNIIHTFRCQMGGGHIDGVISSEAFQWLSKSGPVTIIIENSDSNFVPESDIEKEINSMYRGVNGPVPFGPEASMRQIAWELDKSLHRILGLNL